jgi:hypothetical protein
MNRILSLIAYRSSPIGYHLSVPTNHQPPTTYPPCTEIPAFVGSFLHRLDRLFLSGGRFQEKIGSNKSAQPVVRCARCFPDSPRGQCRGRCFPTNLPTARAPLPTESSNRDVISGPGSTPSPRHVSEPRLESSGPEWAQWSDREIARWAAVSHHTVAAIRTQLSGQIAQIDQPRLAERKEPSANRSQIDQPRRLLV